MLCIMACYLTLITGQVTAGSRSGLYMCASVSNPSGSKEKMKKNIFQRLVKNRYVIQVKINFAVIF